MEWMILPLKRYAQFRGRSRRKEFWMFILFVIIASIVLSILDSVLGLGGSSFAGREETDTAFFAGARSSGGLLTGLFSLGILIPSLAVQVRRLHDTDRSGWWVLAPFVPYAVGIGLMVSGAIGQSGGALAIGGAMMVVGFVLAIILLVFMCLDGTRGENRFGADPKHQDVGDVFA